jgi:hypothetical protein
MYDAEFSENLGKQRNGLQKWGNKYASHDL